MLQSVHAAGPVPAVSGLMANARRPADTTGDGFVERRKPVWTDSKL